SRRSRQAFSLCILNSPVPRPPRSPLFPYTTLFRSQVLVAVDTPSPARLGSLAPRVERTVEAGGSVLVIDHHASNLFYGTHHVVDTEAEASAVVAMRVLDAMGLPLTEPVARGLYAGLVTDTSSFRRARPETHRLAARLIEAGVDPDGLGRTLLDDHPFTWL